MAEYDAPLVLSMNLGVIDFGAGADVTFDVPLPAGARYMRVVDILVRVTEAFLVDLTAARVDIGRAGDLDEFASLTIPDGQALNSIRGGRDQTAGILNKVYVAQEGGTAVMDKFRVTAVFGTDGTGVTGQGEVTVVYAVDFADTAPLQ